MLYQQAANSNPGPGPNTCSVSMTHVAGNTLIIVNRMNPGLNSTISDTIGNSYTPGPAPGKAGIFGFGLFLHFCQNTLGGANTITGHTSGTTDEAIAVYEYPGLVTSGGPLGANYFAQNGPGNGADIVTSGALPVGSVPALLFSFGADFTGAGGVMPPAGTGFNGLGAVWSDYNSAAQGEDQRILVPSYYAGTFSLPARGGDVYAALAVAFAELGAQAPILLGQNQY